MYTNKSYNEGESMDCSFCSEKIETSVHTSFDNISPLERICELKKKRQHTIHDFKN
uniref:Uncharacterized protein n=1 Tax=Lepeophtheirus salmonis TaxID=72036 RepID=A0A0K2T560_LEPSM